MIISNITPPQVWTSSSRSLTNIGSGALAVSDTVFTTLAANSTVDLRSSSGIVGSMTIAVITGVGATAASLIQIWDGTTAVLLVSTAAAAVSPAAFHSNTTNSVGPRVNNTDATHNASYIVSGWVFTI